MNNSSGIEESATADSAASPCTGPTGEDSTTAKNLRFIFIAPVVEERFYEPVKRGMQDAAAAMNVEASFTGTFGVDLNEQAQMIKEAASAGYDGIVANLVDPKVFDVVVKDAVEKGVPVIAFNTDAGKHNARLSAIGQDYVAAGKALGARVADLVRPGDTVLITMHDRGISGLEKRCAGISEVLKSRGIHCKVGVAHSTSQGSANAISQLLKQDAAIKFICATGLADTEGAGHVVEKEYSECAIGVAGFDLSPEILRLIDRGIIRATIDQRPYLQGFYPVVQLALYCRYGITPCDIDLGAEVVTKCEVDNIRGLSATAVR